MKHLVRELGSTDNEHPTGHDARQREQPAAGPPTLRQRLHRLALKRDGVSQSQKTRTSFKLAPSLVAEVDPHGPGLIARRRCAVLHDAAPLLGATRGSCISSGARSATGGTQVICRAP